MAEFAVSGLAGSATGHCQEALTPERIELALADFRRWLYEVAASPSIPTRAATDQEALDLHTLLAQFTALRHEVNLQTRSSRAQQEQNNQALEQLGQTMDALRQAQAAAREAARQDDDSVLRPLLKTLVDAHDALALAAREVQRGRDAVLEALDRAESAAQMAVPQRGSYWARLFGAAPSPPAPLPPGEMGKAAERARQLLEALLAGYTMSLQRLERTLREAGLEPIHVVGAPFDPEQMEVVAAVAESSRPAGEVIEEVRRGYLWNGRVFRYAQVSVAR
jgi:molecular chaperone GrpE